MSDPAVIHGRVLDGSGAPVPHAGISVLNSAGRQLTRATTHRDGTYVVRVSTRGSLVLLASAPGHQPQIASLVVDSASITHDLVLLAGPGGLVGTVRDAAGDSVAGARVEVIDMWGEVTASTTTGTSGAYRIDDLVPDRYTVTTTAPGRHPVSTGVTVNGSDLSELITLDGKSHNRFDLTVGHENT